MCTCDLCGLGKLDCICIDADSCQSCEYFDFIDDCTLDGEFDCPKEKE